MISRRTGSRVLALSQRITKPDGSFGGVVLGTRKLSCFRDLPETIGLGEQGAVNLSKRQLHQHGGSGRHRAP
ncbi:hypothetical protein [Methylobacterium sp. ID0610]|uniref:hypothetical protein n=1 Tax=Methylobacterium carpenticola TaxID=3344827 RepID=UPI0036956010